MSHRCLDRRRFLGAVGAGLAAGAFAAAPPARQPFSPLTVISGKPRERGRAYGKKFAAPIAAFLDRELYRAFTGKPNPKPAILRYAAACGKAVKEWSAEIHDEMQGLAEGAGIKLEEVVLMSLHEELGRMGALPKVPHCTAVAAGPPATRDGHTYVGQTWDWMPSVARLSSMLLWKRGDAPSVLAYSYPGLWVGAGLNSSGIAFTWTSAAGKGSKVAVGIPSYALLTQLLYQPTIDDVIKEAKRARRAGWFTFVMADGKGNLLNVEGSPDKVAIERPRGTLARVGFGSREMTGTNGKDEVRLHPRCKKTYDLLEADKGKIDAARMRHYFAEPKCGICVGASTLDLMVFDTTAKEAFLSRGEKYGVGWQRYTFDEPRRK